MMYGVTTIYNRPPYNLRIILNVNCVIMKHKSYLQPLNQLCDNDAQKLTSAS